MALSSARLDALAGTTACVAALLLAGCAPEAAPALAPEHSASRVSVIPSGVPSCSSDAMVITRGLCRGEDWWLPEDVRQSTEGVVTMYSRQSWDALLDFHAPSAPELATSYNAYTRNVTGQTTTNKMSAWEYDESTESWSSDAFQAEKMLFQLSESDCISYCEEQQQAALYDGLSWRRRLIESTYGAYFPALRDTYDASVDWGALSCRDDADRTLCSDCLLYTSPSPRD